MVLKLIISKIKKFLNVSVVYVVLLLIVYLIVNVIYLIWYIANPEGFWGVSYFLELLKIAVLVIGLSFILILFIGILISTLFSVFKKQASKKDFLKLLGMLLFAIVISVFNYFFYNGISLYLTKSFSDKYSYIEKTEEYIQKGESITALDYAKESYDKELNKAAVSPFLFITKLYSGSDFAQKQRLISKYAAIINYGFCLKENLNSDRKAEKLFNEAISISNNSLLKPEKENLQIFPILLLAEINLSKGNYLVAENYFNKLTELNNKAQIEDAVYLINSKMLFADQALRIGDIKKTMELNIENLHIYEISGLSKTSTNYLSLLLLATTSELYLQHYKSAGELLIKAQSLTDEKTDESIYLQFLLVKGNYCYQVALNEQGNEELIYKNWWNKFVELFTKGKSLKEQFVTEAEKCFVELVDETKSRTGDNNIQYIESLNRLAVFYSNTGRFIEAQNILRKAIAILKPLKNDHKDYYNKLLISSLVVNDPGKLIDENVFETIEVQLFNKITSNYLFLTEDEKEKFISNIERDITSINSVYLKQNTFKANERLYNNVLATKNIALFSNQNLRNFISKADGSLKSDYIKLLNEKERLSLLSKKENSEELQRDLKLKEREIIAKVSKNPLFQSYNPRLVQWNDIKKALKENETAIEIINVPINYLQKQDFQYYALIIKHDSKYPETIPLFKESNLTTILNAKGETEQRVNTIYYENKDVFYDLIWKSLEPHLASSSKVYLSLSGLLHKISFPALLIDKQWDIQILGSTRQVLNLNSSSPNKLNIALFGGVDYDFNSKNRSFSSIDNEIQNTFKSGKFSNLKYTESEVSEIKQIFEKYSDKKPLIFLKNEASEQKFRRLDKNTYNIIHLATHGFYYNINNLNNASASGLDGEMSINQSSMYRSGILLAGANNSIRDTDNDGVLTAVEISRMDLSKVDLVVLSACETGLGDVLGSEGVFGLQRAFKLSGVHSLIVSLWQVPDKQTSELMAQFYHFYLNGIPKNEALKKAQMEIRKKYPEPFNWAGFVLLE